MRGENGGREGRKKEIPKKGGARLLKNERPRGGTLGGQTNRQEGNAIKGYVKMTGEGSGTSIKGTPFKGGTIVLWNLT